MSFQVTHISSATVNKCIAITNIKDKFKKQLRFVEDLFGRADL